MMLDVQETTTAAQRLDFVAKGKVSALHLQREPVEQLLVHVQQIEQDQELVVCLIMWSGWEETFQQFWVAEE